MINVTQKVVDAIRQGARLDILIELSPTHGEAITITNSDIVKNSFSFDRYVQSGDKLEIGSAIASEVKFKLNNNSGKFDNVIFEGAEIKVSVKVMDTDGEIKTYQLGFFVIDEQPKKLSTITVSALDRMMKLDIPYDPNGQFTYGSSTTVAMAILHICVDCGVSSLLSDYTANITNRACILPTRPTGDNLTYRQVLQYICQIACCNAYFDNMGRLRIGWFGDFNCFDFTLDKYDRYSSTLEESTQTVNQLTISYLDESTEIETSASYPQGETQGLTFTVNENPLSYFSANDETVQSLYENKFADFEYRPFSAEVKPFFFLEPMDKIVFKDKNDNEIQTVITHLTFNLNGNMQIQAKGESLTKTGYATISPLTAEQKRIVEKTAENKLSAKQLSLIEFNKAIAGGMGLNSQIIDGVEYSFEGATPQESQYIMVKNSAGIAWTDEGWGEDGPVFKYGISSNGEAILSSVQAYHINAELITVQDLSAFRATIGGWSIDEKAIYKDYQSSDGSYYRSYFQAPGVSTSVSNIDDHWVLSSQLFDSSRNFEKALFYLTSGGRIYGQELKSNSNVETNINGKNIYAGLIHHRSAYEARFGISDDYGAISLEGAATISQDGTTSKVIQTRVDFYAPTSNAVTLRTQAYTATNTNKGYITFGEDFIHLANPHGTVSTNNCKGIMCRYVNANAFNQASTSNIKTNIAACDNVIDLFSAENSSIYSYNYLKSTENSDGMSTDSVEVEEKISYGFIIGEDYNVPAQVLSSDGNAVDLYSMAALNWKATQELLTKIQTLENKLNEMGA